MRFAITEPTSTAGVLKVVNIAESATALGANWVEDTSGTAQIGGTYANGVFSAPVVTPVSPTRNISKNSFFDRLGNDLPAIYTLAKTNTGVAIWLDRLKMAPEKPDGLSVPLDDPRTIAGVTFVYQQLEASGSIAAGQAAVRSAAILG